MLTLQEIKEQYHAMAQTQEYLADKVSQVKVLFDEHPKSTIVFLGSGSSYSVGETCVQNTITGLKRMAIAMTAGDVLIHGTRYEAVFKDSIVVAISRSGETTEILRALDAVKKMGKVHILSISCKVDTPLGKASDLPLEMPWAFDNSVCQTRTVSCLYFSWIYLIGKLSGNETQLSDLQKVIDHGDAYLVKWNNRLQEMAKQPWDHVVVLGDAELGGICEEGALAFKEICQLPSNYYHVLDVRHGPMVLIGKDTLVIMPLSQHSTDLQKALVADLKKKGATIIVYTNQKMDLDGVCNVYFGQELSYPVMGLPFILIPQLVSYYKSLITGTDPDNPTGLSAWIELA